MEFRGMDFMMDDEEVDEFSVDMDRDINDASVSHHEYNIEGVPVEFPYKAYQCQLDMMRQIILGIKTGENCLIQSPTPTGTGKTLSILCSTLAWNKKCCEDKTFYKESEVGPCSCGFVPTDENICHEYNRWKECVEIWIKNGTEFYAKKPLEELCRNCILRFTRRNALKLPTIIYATRTQSQIAGVVKQLKKSKYNTATMNILASRKHTCVNLDVLLKESVDDECKKMVKNAQKSVNQDGTIIDGSGFSPTCPYYRYPRKEQTKIFKTFQHERKGICWDIEDIVNKAKTSHSCAYFGTKSIQQDSNPDIVFCSYNYLLQSFVRKSSQMDITNSIVVFDEGHNIEGVCRDATSMVIKQSKLDKVRKLLDKLLHDHGTNVHPLEYQNQVMYLEQLSKSLQGMSTWLINEAARLRLGSPNTLAQKSMESEEFVNEFTRFNFGFNDLEHHLTSLDAFRDVEHDNLKINDDFEEGGKLKFAVIPEEILKFVEKLVHTLILLYRLTPGRTTIKINEDYKVIFEAKASVVQSSPIKTSSVPSFRSPVSQARSSSSKSEPITFKHDIQLHIICLNPAIGFKLIKNSSRCIIVTSGTLNPLTAFEKELDTPFPIKLQTEHVIPRSNVWAAVVARSADSNFEFTFRKWSTEPGQDDLGKVILDICNIVPHGVLVFFPSYGCLEAMKSRWYKSPEGNSVVTQLEKLKKVYWEAPGKGDALKFKSVIRKFKEEANSVSGSLLFGVFRVSFSRPMLLAKVSEGVDFANHEARAVVSVGIPLAYFKAPAIESNEWYNTQAMRALNQGLGRCLRHKDDWGAIIMLEERLCWANFSKLLPGFVRSYQKDTFTDMEQMKSSLKDFFTLKMTK